ncbi:hypothetical protein ACFL1O_00220 [Patescibacteria group bacterium]
MQSKKIAIIILTAFVALFLIWFLFFRKENSAPEDKILAPLPETQKLVYELSPEIKTKEPLEFMPKSITEEIQRFVPIKELEKEFVEKENMVLSSTPEQVSKPTELTDEEYFDLFYPESYIEYLNTMQETMVDDNYINNEEVVVFEVESDVYPILVKIIDYVADKEYITEVERLSFKGGVEELKELNKIERPYMIEQLLGFLIRKAYAFEVSAGAECYRMGVGGPIGFNAASFCCNCGWYCTPKGCIFLPDCGPGSAACHIPLGCLNSLCFGRPAIWDPMTGICGCG